MKNIISLIVIAFISFPISSYAQQKDEKINATVNQISIGIKDSLYSNTLAESRELWIHTPKAKFKGQKFPVIYLLDAEWNFEAVVSIMNSYILNRLCPEMIIVAIPNTNRMRDLSTSHIGDDANPSGGAKNFMKFLEHELIPFINNKYPTTSYRTFIGHSLGGLLVVNTLMKQPHLFNNYVAIDPSLGWDNQKMLSEVGPSVKEKKFENKSLYVAIANTLRNGKTYDQALKDSTTATLHIRSIVEFSKQAKSNKQLHSKWKYYPDEIHGILPMVAEHDAFRFLFSWYKFDQIGEFYAPEPKLSGEELVQLMVSHSEKISKNLGYLIKPNEDEMNRFGYLFLQKKDYKRALPFFKFNMRSYPQSANVYDSMGDYYNSVSDKSNAIKYFLKALELGGVDGTKEKLEALQGKK